VNLIPLATWIAALGVLPAWLAFQRWRGRDPLGRGTRLAIWPLSLLATGLVVVAGGGMDPLGLGRPGARTVGVALVATIAMVIVWPLITRIQPRSGAPDVVESSVYRSLAALPFGYRAFLVLTAGVNEELLYRGVGVGFGRVFFGSFALAAALSLFVFTAAHLRWGRAYLLSVLYSGSVLTLAFALTGDLIACMLAHTLVDALGLLAGPALRARYARAAAGVADDGDEGAHATGHPDVRDPRG
jgi:membrane protease YdiL (CAAX protease family)